VAAQGPPDQQGDRSVTSEPVGRGPCAFSPALVRGRQIADFFASMFDPEAHVLELGFGQGLFLEAATARGIRVVGLDRDEFLVTSARARGFEVHAGDVRNLKGLSGNQFDGVLAAHIIEHLQPDEVSQLLHEVAQVTRAGGRLVIVTPNIRDWQTMSEWFWQDPTHVRPYPGAAVLHLADRAEWTWDGEGYEPPLKRSRLKLLVQRARFGSDYGYSSRWYRLRRQPTV
jgi:SAM-dependent methyltransferase